MPGKCIRSLIFFLLIFNIQASTLYASILNKEYVSELDFGEPSSPKIEADSPLLSDWKTDNKFVAQEIEQYFIVDEFPAEELDGLFQVNYSEKVPIFFQWIEIVGDEFYDGYGLPWIDQPAFFEPIKNSVQSTYDIPVKSIPTPLQISIGPSIKYGRGLRWTDDNKPKFTYFKYKVNPKKIEPKLLIIMTLVTVGIIFVRLKHLFYAFILNAIILFGVAIYLFFSWGN